jgi:hypothetical protein
MADVKTDTPNYLQRRALGDELRAVANVNTAIPKKTEAEKAKSHELEEGKEGTAEYNRILAKEGKTTKIDGTCPLCKEQLEEPVTRGHHSECWNDKMKREAEADASKQ